MSRRIVIGDVHGCYHTLITLLDKIQIQPKEDELYFLGDLVGKGRFSNRVLDYITTYPQCALVLGNHDVSWLRHCFHVPQEGRGDFVALANHPNATAWQNFLLKQPFLIDLPEGLLVHAAIDYQWDLADAHQVAKQLSQDLRDNPQSFFANIQEPKVLKWDKILTKAEERYLALQIFTRARYYHHDGRFELECTEPPENKPELIPWYQQPRKIKKPIWFGHWASLSARQLAFDFNLDGGAVYGGKLIAMDLISKERWAQKKVVEDE